MPIALVLKIQKITLDVTQGIQNKLNAMGLFDFNKKQAFFGAITGFGCQLSVNSLGRAPYMYKPWRHLAATIGGAVVFVNYFRLQDYSMTNARRNAKHLGREIPVMLMTEEDFKD